MGEPPLRASERRRSASAKATRVVLVGCLTTALSVVLPIRIPARTLGPMPHTAGREVAIRLSDLVPRGQEKGLRVFGDGAVQAARRMTLAPAVTCPSMPFTALGLVWDQQGRGALAAHIQVGPNPRSFGPSAALDDESGDAPDAGSAEDHPGRRHTTLLWVGRASCSKLTVTLPSGVRLGHVRAVFVNSAGTAPAESLLDARPSPAAGFGLGASPAEAATVHPAIITRAQWGANEKLRNCGPYYSGPGVKMAFVHHTANPNSYSPSQSDDLIRAIYWYHTQALGWCDIAYNFLVDRFGRIFEGRYGGMTLPVLPGATKGFNTGSVAVSALGTFSTATPPPVMVAAIERLLAWRLDVAHVPPIGTVWMYSRGSTGGKYPEGKWVMFNRIAGHLDAGFTSCPGSRLYALLGSIRRIAYNTGLPKIFLPKEDPASMVEGDQVVVAWTASASESLWWRVEVLDRQNNVIASWKRWGSTLSVSWTAVDQNGRPLAPGTYAVKISGSRSGRTALPAMLQFIVVPPPPPPSPSPSPSPSDSPSPSPS